MRLLFLIAVGIAGFVCQAREVVVLEKTGAAIQRAIDAVAKEGDDCIVMRANRSPDGDSDLCEDLEVVNCSLDPKFGSWMTRIAV